MGYRIRPLTAAMAVAFSSTAIWQTAIAETTMKNITDFEHGRPSPNEVALDPAKH